MEDFINEYFIDPIIERTGYNPVNTITYAAIAIVLLYAAFYIFKRYNVQIDKKFVYSVIPFILLGSTIRVITDSLDNNAIEQVTFVHQFVVQSGLYKYGFLTTSPGIYIVISSVFLVSLFVGRKLKFDHTLIGILLLLFHLTIIVPFFENLLDWFFVLLLAGVPFFAAWYITKNEVDAGIVGAQALDGGATFYAMEIFSKVTYGEQHVFTGMIGEMFGSYVFFYLLKILLASLIVYFLETEKISENEKNYISIAVIIFGLAPGFRDLLRILLGV